MAPTDPKSSSTRTLNPPRPPQSEKAPQAKQTPEERAAAKKKRTYDDFVADAKNETESKQYKVLRPYQRVGLAWPRAFSLWGQIGTTIVQGQDHEAEMRAQEENEEEEEDEAEELTKEQREAWLFKMRNIQTFEALKGRYPWLYNRLEECIEYDDLLTQNRIVSVMHKASLEARRTDTALLKSGVVDWLPYAMEKNIEALPNDFSFRCQPLSNGILKDDRGLAHPLTRAFLIPFSHMHLIYHQSDGVEACKKLFKDMRDGSKRRKSKSKKSKKGSESQSDTSIPLTSSSLCAFLYDLSLFKPGSPKSGLLRGPLLKCGYRAVFKGRSRAMGESVVATKAGNAQRLGLLKVTPETLAYIAAQIRFALCPLQSWSKQDGEFNNEIFYYHILDIMKHGSEAWRDELFEHWNTEIFGDEEGPSMAAAPEEGSDMAMLWQEFEDDSATGDEEEQAPDELAEEAPVT